MQPYGRPWRERIWHRELRGPADKGEHPPAQTGPQRLEGSLTCSRQVMPLDLGDNDRLPRDLLMQHAFVCHDERFLVKESVHGSMRQYSAYGLAAATCQ